MRSFRRMLRRQVEGDQRAGETGKAEALKLGYDPAREPDLPFETSWIQDRHNQLVMLDTFFGALKPDEVSCFFLCQAHAALGELAAGDCRCRSRERDWPANRLCL